MGNVSPALRLSISSEVDQQGGDLRKMWLSQTKNRGYLLLNLVPYPRINLNDLTKRIK